MDIDSNCPYLLFGETTSHLTSRTDGGVAISPVPGPTAPAGDNKFPAVHNQIIWQYLACDLSVSTNCKVGKFDIDLKRLTLAASVAIRVDMYAKLIMIICPNLLGINQTIFKTSSSERKHSWASTLVLNSLRKTFSNCKRKEIAQNHSPGHSLFAHEKWTKSEIRSNMTQNHSSSP